MMYGLVVLTAATTGADGSEIESVNSACGLVSSVISDMQFNVMIFDTAPLLLEALKVFLNWSVSQVTSRLL
jgi:hypothetical protein